MANYANLIAAIQNVVKTNGNNEITGALMQQSLLAMVNSLGANYQYAGIATPDTNPGTPDQNVFYLAVTEGTYSNFNAIAVTTGEIALLKYNGSWTKDSYVGLTKKILQEIAVAPFLELTAETKSNLRVLSSGISTVSGEILMFVPVFAGQKIRVDFSIASGAFMRRGFTTEVPVLHSSVTGFSSQSASYTAFEDTAPIDGYLVFSTQSASLNTYTIKLLKDDVGGDVYTLKEQVEGLEEAAYIEEQIPGVSQNGIAYGGNVDSAPTASTTSQYIAMVFSNLRKGDSVTAHCWPGASYRNWLKVSNGIITARGAAGAEFNSTIECDGTFDEVIFNSYTPRVTPTGSAKCYFTAKEYIDKYAEGKVTLRVLCFGNSFTEDAMGYVPFILKNLYPSIDFTLGIAFQGGSPLAEHCAYITGETITFAGDTYQTVNGVYQKNGNTRNYTYLKSASGTAFVSSTGKTVEQMLSDEEWDLITFQQGGLYLDSSWETAYAPFIYKVQKALLSKLTHTFSLGWILVHGAYTGTAAGRLSKWSVGAERAESVMKLTGASVLLPYGTAVQNLRTTSLGLLGDYANGGALQVDEAHLQAGIGALTAAYANVLALLQYVVAKCQIINEETRPTATWITENNIPTHLGTGVIGISDANVFLAQVAALKAVNSPYELTDISPFEN